MSPPGWGLWTGEIVERRWLLIRYTVETVLGLSWQIACHYLPPRWSPRVCTRGGSWTLSWSPAGTSTWSTQSGYVWYWQGRRGSLWDVSLILFPNTTTTFSGFDLRIMTSCHKIQKTKFILYFNLELWANLKKSFFREVLHKLWNYSYIRIGAYYQATRPWQLQIPLLGALTWIVGINISQNHFRPCQCWCGWQKKSQGYKSNKFDWIVITLTLSAA